MNTSQQGSPSGFTLLELLIVMTIISILASVAIPEYKDFRSKAYDAKAQIELRNISLAEELYYSDSGEYLSCSDQSCTELPSIPSISKEISVNVVAEDDAFTATVYHSKGKKIFSWDSAQGGQSEEIKK